MKFDGIWTSGVDSSIVDALKTANHALVPIVGADNAGLRHPAPQRAGPQGRGGDQPGGRRRRRRHPGPPDPRGEKPARPTVHVTPELWDNHDRGGQGRPDRRPEPERSRRLWPLGLTIKDWTTYTMDDLIACKGPGEVTRPLKATDRGDVGAAGIPRASIDVLRVSA